MTPSELATMPGDKCILQLRGLPPFYSPKYDLTKHPNYKLSLIHIYRSILPLKARKLKSRAVAVPLSLIKQSAPGRRLKMCIRDRLTAL